MLHTLAIIMETRQPLEQYPAALFDAIASCYETWLTRRINDIARGGIDPARVEQVVSSSTRAVLDELYRFLQTDVDEQRSNPLHILRQSTASANQLLAEASVEPAVRDEFEVSAMPHDVFSIGPLTWRDLSDDVHEAGITWGAWKAATVLSRRRNEGKLD